MRALEAVDQRLNLQHLSRDDLEELVLRSVIEIQSFRRAKHLNWTLATAVGALIAGAAIAILAVVLGAALS